MSKKVKIKLTKHQARQVWHMMNMSTASISAAIGVGQYDGNTMAQLSELLVGDSRNMITFDAWEAVDLAVEEAGMDLYE
jgi:hypothetical protein